MAALLMTRFANLLKRVSRRLRGVKRRLRGVKRPFDGFSIPHKHGVMLNLGCGHDYREGMINVDSSGTKCDIECDLAKDKLPFDDASVDYILASHLLEHLPDFGLIMNECHRVLKPGGLFDIIVPLPCEAFWRDPTHIRPYTASTFKIYAMLPKDSPYSTYLGLGPWSGCSTKEQVEDYNGDDLHVLYVKLTR
jgi:SAM-dependent methyltransferase